jgi:hypothetical protein
MFNLTETNYKFKLSVYFHNLLFRIQIRYYVDNFYKRIPPRNFLHQFKLIFIPYFRFRDTNSNKKKRQINTCHQNVYKSTDNMSENLLEGEIFPFNKKQCGDHAH